MAKPTIYLRTLGPNDLARCVELSSEAGWNQNEGDWRFLLEHGYGYGVDLADKGLVATTGAWSMGENFTWINMVLVTQSCRGLGLARSMLSRCLADTKARGQVALLDATDQGVPVYEKLGFRGTPTLVRLKRSDAEGKVAITEPREVGCKVELMRESDLPEVQAMDLERFGADRRTLLASLRRRSPPSAWVLRDRKGTLRGFLLGRGGRSARQLGPLLVESARDARALVGRALEQIKGPVYMDVPELHLGWLGELSKLGFQPERRFRRMGQDGEMLQTDWERYFAMAGPDFA